MGPADQEEIQRIIARQREKYGPPTDGWLPASMRKGSDKLPFFWIGYFIIFGLLALYFGIQSGG
ncbi:hypothetical protein AB0P05_26710 [Streptomyces flaveolus]|uniref:hypothetical protein n=1 Tax=Streptomyces flaveolus TaxID=67297 RepID=UPI003417BC30